MHIRDRIVIFDRIDMVFQKYFYPTKLVKSVDGAKFFLEAEHSLVLPDLRHVLK